MSPESQSLDLAWAHNPMRALLRLAWPIAVSTVSYSVMTLVDTFFVGHLGGDALAGVGLAGMIAFCLIMFGLGLLRALKVLISQSIGAGRPDEVAAVRAAGLWFAAGLGLLAVVMGAGISALLETVWHDTLHDLASAHLRIRSFAAPAVLLANALRESRQAEGDSQSPMWAALGANLVNVALNWVFVGTLGFGVEGSAWATLIAHVLEVAFLVFVQRRGGLSLRTSRKELAALWRIGVPTGVQFLLEMGSFALLTFILSSLGSVEMAAHQIAIQVIHFSFLPALAVSEAASVLVGNAVGANEDRLVNVVTRHTLIIAGGYTFVCGLVFGIFRVEIASVFTSDPDVIRTGARLLVVAAFFQAFDAANIVFRCVLRATGDVRVPAIVGVCCAWLLTPPTAWVLGVWFGWGALGGWIGISGEIVLAAAILGYRFLKGDWKSSAARSRASIADLAEPAVTNLA